jgi:hypothetical protein
MPHQWGGKKGNMFDHRAQHRRATREMWAAIGMTASGIWAGCRGYDVMGTALLIGGIVLVVKMIFTVAEGFADALVWGVRRPEKKRLEPAEAARAETVRQLATLRSAIPWLIAVAAILWSVTR